MKAGFVSLVGRPNAGKSTLLNRFAGQKIAIVSDKPQTTRHRILGVRNAPAGQIVFIDTPGIREFGLWDVAQDDLALFFPEMRSFVGMCKFGLDCQHDQEPGCAIRQAVSAGARKFFARVFREFFHAGNPAGKICVQRAWLVV